MAWRASSSTASRCTERDVTGATNPNRSSRGRARLPLVLLVVLLVVLLGALLAVAYLANWLDAPALTAYARNLRRREGAVVEVVVFLALWGVLTSIGLPALPLMIAGGALFGLVAGTVLNTIGSTIGAAGAYLLSRALAPRRLQRWTMRRLPIADVSHARGFLQLVRLRLLPIMPFGAVSFAAGIARIPFRPYIVSTIIGHLPSTVLYAYFADRLLQRLTAGEGPLGFELVIFSALLSSLLLISLILRRL